MAPAPRQLCLPLLGRLVLAALACLPPLSGERLRGSRRRFLPQARLREGFRGALPAGRPGDPPLARSAGRPQPRCFWRRPRGDPNRRRPLIALRRSAGGCGRGGDKFKPGSSGLRFGAFSDRAATFFAEELTRRGFCAADSLAVMSVDLGSESMKIALVKPGVPMEIVLNK